MRIRRFSIKLGPFRWTWVKARPTKTAQVPVGVNAAVWPQPGWYWSRAGRTYIFWDGHKWTVDSSGQAVF